MILDATCGLKQMWFQKDAEDVVYLDRRNGSIYPDDKEWLKKRPQYSTSFVKPTIQADIKHLPFKDNVFDMIVYDPPHVVSNPYDKNLHYVFGVLNPITWVYDMRTEIKELFRVLKPNMFLVFKWSEYSRTLKIVLQLFPSEPLFGTKTKDKNGTWWIVFRKD